jgi:hypothetical protein
MRTVLPDILEMGRLQVTGYKSKPGDKHGAFHLPFNRLVFKIISSGDGPLAKESGWEHVSASLEFRAPFWFEMCCIKELFWEDEEAVLQFHPPKSEYVNYHPNCLHLWKPLSGITLPPSDLVGPKEPKEPTRIFIIDN